MAFLSTEHIRVFASKLFTFIVGEDKKTITLHAKAVANLSPTLDALINGLMSEAKTGEMDLDDVSEDTFTRFSQFAYTGDYETPSSVSAPIDDSSGSGSAASSPVSAVAEPGEEVTERTEDPYWTSILRREGRRDPPKPPTLRQEFDDKVYSIELVDAARSEAKTRCEIRGNQEGEDYTPVFLGHAHLYVFADKWGIESLKALALHKLHRTLVEFTLSGDRCGDIAELVNFSYSNDNTPDLENSIDALRALVTQYVMCELGSLLKVPDFISSQEQQGLFTRDLLLMMRKRLK